MPIGLSMCTCLFLCVLVLIVRIPPPSPTGEPTSPYVHAIKVNKRQAQHFGFWSPPLETQWYWPTAGVSLFGDLYVIAMRMMSSGSGLFPFATAGMDVLHIKAPNAQPLTWPDPDILTIPGVNNTFTVGNAVTLGGDGYVYLLGGNNGSAMMTRILVKDFVGANWDALGYWCGPEQQWQQYAAGGGFAPQALFAYVPSETTLYYHPVMGLWYIMVANTFLTNAVCIRTAPDVTGPWSDLIPVYDIPQEQLTGAFCYAGKAHPELSPPGAAEFVFSYMCNTNGIPPLLNRTDIYTPRLIRTNITMSGL